VDDATATRRLAGLLARRGYPASLAFAVVREALSERAVDEPALPDDGDDIPLD
jgi:regulatory protein